MSKKTIVILSGGLDSTTLLWHLKASGSELRALSINYGQRHKRELIQAAKLAAIAGVEHRIVDLSTLQPLLTGSSQTDPAVEVPEGHYEEKTMLKTIVAHRNLMMLTVAAQWASSLKYDSVSYGAHRGDSAVYPDCREEFVQSAEKTFELSDWHKVAIDRPFVNMTKGEIAQLAERLGVPISETFSCYKGGEIQCGRCSTCFERIQSMDQSGVKDPTVYLDRDFYKTYVRPVEVVS